VARSSTFAEECLERRYARHPARAPRLAGSALRVGASAAPAPGALVRRPVESPRGARRSQSACRARAGHVHAPGRRPAINKPAPPPTRRRPASRQWSALGLAHRPRVPRRRRALQPLFGVHALGRGRHHQRGPSLGCSPSMTSRHVRRLLLGRSPHRQGTVPLCVRALRAVPRCRLGRRITPLGDHYADRAEGADNGSTL
jgi:hypothetical protein